MQQLVILKFNALNALKPSGPGRIILGREEIGALSTDKKLMFFSSIKLMRKSHMPWSYYMATAVADAIELSFVDLACSEGVKTSGCSGIQLKEAQSINKSLSALGDVISALSPGGQHIPYRNNKLTMLMSDSRGGNAMTLMIVNISPAESNTDETQFSRKLPEAFVTRVKTPQKTEEDDFADGSETGYSESPAHAPDCAHAPVSDLLDLGLDNSGAIVSVDQPTKPAEHVHSPLVMLKLTVNVLFGQKINSTKTRIKTAVIGIPGLKCAIQTPSPEIAALCFEALKS
ncbi:hypothetical protein ACH5RR_021965 [Cinchona calisaya]|uniref:Kinesin motor domain-containing protein n=1 Tax=Cinchona calisaya TaxID=153742 RepID=A0ABD2Z7J2_9GENT